MFAVFEKLEFELIRDRNIDGVYFEPNCQGKGESKSVMRQ